jgi:hypothetical protein
MRRLCNWPTGMDSNDWNSDRFKRTIELLDKTVVPKLKLVR